MATATNKNQVISNSNISISGIAQKIASWIKSPTQKANTSVSYSEADYYKDQAEKEAKKSIEKAKYSVYSYPGI